MSVGVNYLGKSCFEEHLSIREGKKSKIKKAIFVSLSLTSMVDVFSMLVVFLLQTFSSTPEILVTKGVSLPEALTTSVVMEAPVLSISKTDLYLDQKAVGKLSDVLAKPVLLIKQLRAMKKNFAKNHPGKAYAGEINLQADEAVPSVIISQIMSHLNSQNYHSIHLAVMSGGR